VAGHGSPGHTPGIADPHREEAKRMPNLHTVLQDHEWRGPGPRGRLSVQIISVGEPDADGFCPVLAIRYGPTDEEYRYVRDLRVHIDALRPRGHVQ
jgi:hypothetical protein